MTTVEELERKLDRVEACEDIRKVLYLYARGVDRCDADLLREVYHDDSTVVHGVMWAGNGQDLVDWLIPQLEGMAYNRHQLSNPIIELDGDRAFVETYFDSTHRFHLDSGAAVDRRAQGRYLDVLEHRDGRWRILHRRIVVDTSWAQELTVEMLQGAAAQTRPPIAELRPGRAPDDPVYRGFGIADIGFESFEVDDERDSVRNYYRKTPEEQDDRDTGRDRPGRAGATPTP